MISTVAAGRIPLDMPVRMPTRSLVCADRIPPVPRLPPPSSAAGVKTGPLLENCFLDVAVIGGDTRSHGCI